ncbi:TPR-like protein [Ceratobasidium sp. AG-I]|nr:TPR-like protein [Ceratobasidium sp. AG-I]
MNLLVSYLPEGSTGEPIVVDLVFSESYDDVLETVCEMLKDELPPEDSIQDRKLARFVKLPSGSTAWVALHPDRFAWLAEAEPVDTLELRLQITCVAAPTQTRSEGTGASSRLPSTSDIPPPYTSTRVNGLNARRPTTIAENNHSSNSSTALGVPLAPTPVFRDNALNRVSSSSLVYNWQDVSNPRTPLGPVSLPTTSGTPTEPRRDYADALFENGLAAFLAGRYFDASYRFQRAAKEYHDRPDPEKEADCLHYLGATCCFLKEYSGARLHLTSAKAIYEGIGPSTRQEQLRCDRHLARVEEGSGNTQAALDAYQELICVSQEEGLPIQEAWCTYHLGHLFSQTRRYEEAFNLLKDVVEMAQRLQNLEIEAFATEDMGYIAERQGHPQLAMKCYDKALGQFETGGNGKWVAYENRVKNRIDKLRREFPSLSSTVVRPRRWSVGQFVNKT